MKFLVPLFQKRVPFLGNTKCCTKFLEYTLGPQYEMHRTATTTTTRTKIGEEPLAFQQKVLT